MKRPSWQTTCLCLAVWAVALGIPWAVYRGLVWITHAMEAR